MERKDILVMVCDTGIGIDSQIKDHLFGKFATKSRSGTGLGLYLSKKIIESHGESIWCEEPSQKYDKNNNALDIGNINNKKTGTIFKFVIPQYIQKKNI